MRSAAPIPLRPLAALLLVAALAAASFGRNSLWREDAAIWQDSALKSPAKARPHYQLGRAYSGMNRPDLAFRCFETARRIDPSVLGRWIDTSRAAGENGPDRSTAAAHRVMQATVLIGQGDYDGALGIVQDVLREDPGDTEAYLVLARIHNRFGRTEDELAAYRAAIERGRETAPKELAWLNQGILFGKLGRYRESAASLREALAIRPSARAHYNLAVTYANMGLAEESKREFAAAEQCRQ